MDAKSRGCGNECEVSVPREYFETIFYRTVNFQPLVDIKLLLSIFTSKLLWLFILLMPVSYLNLCVIASTDLCFCVCVCVWFVCLFVCGLCVCVVCMCVCLFHMCDYKTKQQSSRGMMYKSQQEIHVQVILCYTLHTT